MKILQVIPYFSPRFGGSVTVPFQLSKELAKNNHNVTIATSDYGFDPKYVKEIEGYGVEVIPFPTKAHFGLFIYTPSLKTWLSDNVKDFDIIHMHNFRSYQNIIVFEFTLKNNIPYIVQAHGAVMPIFEKQYLKKLYDVVWGYKILKNASRVIALCESEGEQYRTMGVPEEKIEIIPNGLDLLQFSNLPTKGTFRSKYSISKYEKIILFLGRIHKIKGIDLLIDAYSELLQEMLDVRLVIVGPDDNYLPVIQKQIQQLKLDKNPLFTGPLYDQEKLAAYVDADVYVLPSRYEIFGNTVLEAWACGTPVIVTDGCLIADIIEKAGYVIPFTANELKEAILKTFTNDKQRMENVNFGLDLIRNEFNLASHVGKIESIYKVTMNSSQKQQ